MRNLPTPSRILLLAILLLGAISLTSCRGGKKAPAGAGKANTLSHAKLLKVWEEEGNRFAEVYSAEDSATVVGLYIFPSGNDSPESLKEKYPDAVIVHPGQKNLLVYTTVHGAALEELGATDAIGAVADPVYFTSPQVRKRIDTGKIVSIGSSQQPTRELIAAAKPSLAIVSVFDGMDVSALQEQGIPILYMADNLEASPLARAEWLKLLAMVAGVPEKGDSIFSSVRVNYTSLTAKASAATSKKPKVLTEEMYQGIWYVPGGGSYSARLIEDAGGIWPWSSDKSAGSLNLSFEQVYSAASDADIWLLKIFDEELTWDGLRERDERNMLFGPVKKSGVWYSNTARSNLFDEFPYHPDLLLADYIAIFHPEVLPDHPMKYFQQVTR